MQNIFLIQLHIIFALDTFMTVQKKTIVYNWTKQLDQIELAVFIAFAFFFLIQIIYYLRIYLPVLFYHKKEKSLNAQPLSVIICARNEAENLENNLSLILEQDYPEFEVIVVNDSSTDHSDEILSQYLKKYNNLRLTNLPAETRFSHGKKLAVTVGIKAAKYENLVFTDADCRPESKNWLMHMQQGFNKHDIVLGYGGYKRIKSLLNNYIRYDSLTIALQYFGFALVRIPYMGVGRNLAYKKELFFKNKGFANHYGILSGDDDLFINEVSNKDNTCVIIDKESFTRSEPVKTLGKFFNQKVRHFSTPVKYKKLHVFLLGMEPLSRVWFYTLLIILLTMPNFWITTLILAASRYFIQIFVYAMAGKKFNEKNIWLSIIIFDVISLFFNFIAYLTLSLRSKKIRWK